MRRIISILFTLVLGLGPVWAAVPADALASGWTGKVDESRLPACCRRNGVHHCGMVSQTADTVTTVSATGACPAFPHSSASPVSPFATMAASRNPLRIAIEHRPLLPFTVAISIGDQRTQPERGPPSSEIL